MSNIECTVVLPTTGNRGKLLPYSVGSIQNQSVQNFEVFIIGDGVSDETREIIHTLISSDSRIRFFDHPKHERRGEVYRHKALQKAKGKFVCYLCDRDLMFPDHLETMKKLLQDYNFVSTTFVNVREDHSVQTGQYIGYYGPESEHRDCGNKAGISLSNAAHTLELYRKLPHGWRTTPQNQFTDVYMWIQFLSHPECRAYSHTEPTVLYFKRGHFPGASVEVREKELSTWSKKITTMDQINDIKIQAQRGLLTEWMKLKTKSKSTVLIKGLDLQEVPNKIIQKVASRLKSF